jgi:hypothetical protein
LQSRDGAGGDASSASTVSSLAPDVVHLWREVRTALPQNGGLELERADALGPRVWRIGLIDGRRFALKIGVEEAPAQKEASILTALAGCPVAQLVAQGGEGHGWLVTEWAGDATLDDALGEIDPKDWERVGTALFEALLCVETALEARAGVDERRREAARVALVEQLSVWQDDALNALLWLLGVGVNGYSLSGKVTQRMRAALDAVFAGAGFVQPRLGSLDYNPRNVIVTTGEQPHVTFVDVPAVGLDWAERRLVQYATVTGARRASGSFASALNADVASKYAQEAALVRDQPVEAVLAGLDAHEVILVLAAATQLGLVERGEAADERAQAWANLPARRDSLRELLARPLATDGPAATVRAMIQSG